MAIAKRCIKGISRQKSARSPSPQFLRRAGQRPSHNLFYDAIICTLRELSEMLSPAQILRTIVHNAGKALAADRCSFVLVDQAQNCAMVVVAYENSKAKGRVLNLDTYPEINRAVATGKTVVIADMRNDPLLSEVRKSHPELASGSLLVLPIQAQPKTGGTFFLRIRRLPRAFTADEIDFCKKIAFISSDALLKAHRLLRLKKDIARGAAARRLMEESVIKYRTLIDGAPWSIFIYQDEAIQFANRKFKEMAGIKARGPIDLAQVLPAESVKLFAGESAGLLAGSKASFGTQVRGRNKASKDLYWNLEAGVIEYQGRPAVECMVKDITYLKELEGRLEQKNLALATAVKQLHELNDRLIHAKNDLQKNNTELQGLYERLQKAHTEKTKFLRLLSHELKNPLGVLRDYFGLLLDGLFGSLNSEQAEVIEESSQRAHQILEMINSLLDYSKIEAGKMRYHFEAHDIVALTQAALAGFRLQGRTRGVRIEQRTEGAVPLVVLDTERMTMALKNLIDNALKHTPDGGAIEVIIRPFTARCPTSAGLLSQPYVEISIQDTGCGVPEEFSEEVFAEFFQIAQSHGPGKGAGLGLHIVREIVQHHHGDIWVDRAYRSGAKFTFVLPIASNEAIGPIDVSPTG
ncbi:MAG: GAF domain-containing protein [Acidobacteria bacterium]|nr:GAF domain-containing protein [Acidobacteriota bacterium]MBI3656102.1 GAF domain-containing protein [Acidobacteriota bacterium]